MKNKRWPEILAIVAALFAGAGIPPEAAGQAEMRSPFSEKGVLFFVDALAYVSEKPEKSRLDVYVQVPYQEVKFVKDADEYVARYELSLQLFDDGDELLVERTWREDVRVPEFAQTGSLNLYRLTQRSLEIAPGPYRLEVLLRDEEAGRSGRQTRTILISDFRKDSLSISDVMMVSKLSTEGDQRTVVPNISGTLNDPVRQFYVFFEIYRMSRQDSVLLRWRLFDADRKEVVRQDRVESTPGQTTQAFVSFSDLNLKPGRFFLSVEAWRLAEGKDSGGVPLAIASRTFSVRSSDLPATITDLEKAIEQLRYVARGAEMDYLVETEDPAERKKRFLEFWQKRDPDPQTPRNELMEEYYDRVEYANKHFSHYLEGWRTDMGMVFIRFGQPENVERHPFEYNSKPYEIWYYYQLNRQFIFVDESGFGDYRLRYPTTDLWGRIR